MNAWISVIVMYITASSSASSLLRASRANTRLFSRAFASSLPKPTSSSSSPSSSAAAYRSLASSSALRSLPRWSHGIHWRSTYTIRSQIRAVAPAIEQFQRKIASMGTLLFIPNFLDWMLTFCDRWPYLIMIVWEFEILIFWFRECWVFICTVALNLDLLI